MQKTKSARVKGEQKRGGQGKTKLYGRGDERGRRGDWVRWEGWHFQEGSMIDFGELSITIVI